MDTSNLPITRLIARAAGIKHFFSGEPCPQGHVAARLASNSTCVVCAGIATRKWMDANRDRMRQKGREWAKRNYERRKPILMAARRTRRFKDRSRERRRAALPTPTRAETHICELCGKTQGRALSLDHDHRTGAFRGWLCVRCNLALGKLGDTLESVTIWTLQAVQYLNRGS
jgi:hypothetical protein